MSDLQKTADLLKTAVNELERLDRRGPSVSADGPPLPVGSQTVRGQSSSRGCRLGNRTVASDVRRLFSPYPTSASRRAEKQPKWSHKFFCLSAPNQEVVPDKFTKKLLYDAGLGEKKIVMPKNNDPKSLKAILLQSYPKLEGGGGFELLRSTSRTCIDIIDPPSSGYTSAFLADESAIGAAIIYVRPLQKELDLSAVFDNCEADDSCPLEECIECGNMIPVIMLRKHIQECHEANDDASEGQPPKTKLQEQPICKFACAQVQDRSDDCSTEKKNDEDQQQTCPVCSGSFKSSLLAVHASTCGEDTASCGDTLSKTPEEALESVYEAFLSTREVCIIRRRFMDTAIEQMEDYDDEDWSKKIKIRFIGEEGVDEGGLSREFFTMLFQKSHMFEDSLIKVDAVLLSKQHYKLMGKLTALALLTGHPGPRCLETHLVKFILFGTEPDVAEISPDVIKRQDVVQAIQQIKEVSEANEAEVNLEVADMLEAVNFRRRVNTNNSTAAVDAIKAHFSYYQCLPALLQYIDGLKINGVLDILKKYPESEKYLRKADCTTSGEVMDMFSPCFSVDDEKKADEELVIYNMNQFLRNVERGRVTTDHLDLISEQEETVVVTVDQVLKAFTGSRFSSKNLKGNIFFNHDSSALSTVNTCSPSIYYSNIKELIHYKKMEEHMLNIIFGTFGFGIV